MSHLPPIVYLPLLPIVTVKPHTVYTCLLIYREITFVRHFRFFFWLIFRNSVFLGEIVACKFISKFCNNHTLPVKLNLFNFNFGNKTSDSYIYSLTVMSHLYRIVNPANFHNTNSWQNREISILRL